MGLPAGRLGRRLFVRLGHFPRSGPASRRPAGPDGIPKEPTISVADQPVEPQPARSRWLRERLAAALGPLGRVPRPALAGLLALVLAAGLLTVHEVAAAGQVRHGVRVGGVELSGLTRAAATERLRAAARDLQA